MFFCVASLLKIVPLIYPLLPLQVKAPQNHRNTKW